MMLFVKGYTHYGMEKCSARYLVQPYLTDNYLINVIKDQNNDTVVL